MIVCVTGRSQTLYLVYNPDSWHPWIHVYNKKGAHTGRVRGLRDPPLFWHVSVVFKIFKIYAYCNSIWFQCELFSLKCVPHWILSNDRGILYFIINNPTCLTRPRNNGCLQLTALQSQKAISVYFKSKQILAFGYVRMWLMTIQSAQPV